MLQETRGGRRAPGWETAGPDSSFRGNATVGIEKGVSVPQLLQKLFGLRPGLMV